jgi:hypothetical protein
VAGAQRHARGHQDGLVAGAADLEEDLVLPLELDLAVVDPPGQIHRPVDGEERPAVQALQAIVEGLSGQISSLRLIIPGPDARRGDL